MIPIYLRILEEYWLYIGGFLAGAFLFKYCRNKEWKTFCNQEKLFIETIGFQIGEDKVKRQVAKLSYPKYRQKKDKITLLNLGYNIDKEVIKSKLFGFERYFNQNFVGVSTDKKRNIVLLKSLMPNEVLPYKKEKNMNPLLGINDQGKKTELNFKQGIRFYIAGGSALGKTTLVESLVRQINEEVEYYILAPRNSFNLKSQKYFDSNSLEEIKKFLGEIETIKEQIGQIKAQMRAEKIRDELFAKYVHDKQIKFYTKIFILDDASTYLKSNLFSKTEKELKEKIELLIVQINKILREYRIYKTSIFVIGHSSNVDEVDISLSNFTHILFNRVQNEAQSRSACGDSKILMSERLKRGLWYLKSENENNYIKTVYEKQKS